MPDLEVYKTLPEWTAETLPPGFRRKHNTRAGTWARLTVLEGALRFDFLEADGAVASSRVLTAASDPLVVAPGVWHRVDPAAEPLRCRLEFLREVDSDT